MPRTRIHMNKTYVNIRIAAFELGAAVALNSTIGNLTDCDSNAEEWADKLQLRDRQHVRQLFIAGFKFSADLDAPNPQKLRQAAKDAAITAHVDPNAEPGIRMPEEIKVGSRGMVRRGRPPLAPRPIGGAWSTPDAALKVVDA